MPGTASVPAEECLNLVPSGDFSLEPLFFKEKMKGKSTGAGVAQADKHSTLDFVSCHDFQGPEIEPCITEPV